MLGATFAVVGSIFLVGLFFIDAYLRGNTAYAGSDDDAYIVRGASFPRVVTFDLQLTAPSEMTRRGDGTATVAFGQKCSIGDRMNMWGIRPMREFEGIPNVAQVYQLVTGQAATPGGSA